MKPTLRKLASLVLVVIIASLPSFAAQTPVTVQLLKQNNYAVQAGDLTVTMTAMDAANGNSYIATGQEVVVVQNTDASPHTFTISSVADGLGRTDTSLTNYSVAANAIVSIQMKFLNGWIQSGGQLVYLSTSSALLKIAVLRYNN